MAKEVDDALEFIDNLLATPCPPEDRLSLFIEGKISTGVEPELIERHISMCPHCLELAHMFGWPKSNTKH